MTLSLRGRLLIGVISLVVIGLVVADVATYELLQKSLFDRVDNQLGAVSTRVTAEDVIASVLSTSGCQLRGGPGGQAASTDFPNGTFTELLNSDGSVQASCTLSDVGTSTQPPMLELPKPLPDYGIDHTAPGFTAMTAQGGAQYRVTVWREDRFNGQFMLFAIPLAANQSTLSSLLLIETVIGLAVVAVVAILAWLLIQFGLRPLQRMGATAGQIAAGDLSRRVEPATPGTEIGRLGLALNSMLSQIEAAFEQRKASENRLRRFIADASHELRTPLTSIRGYSEMLRRGASESPEDSSLARRRIEEESVRMSTLVDDMLLIARLDQGRPLETKPVDLQSIARDAAADARAVAPQREINLVAPTPVVVTGDDTRLRQVLGNLVRNALVHTPPTTPIEIAVSTDDGLARMSVADHGPGLGPDEMNRIFEPFYRADPSRSRDSGGAGLGLSIVNAVVGAHGGSVKVKPTDGGGATFEVELPLLRPPA
ncbi:MAG TPA: HAMP domain-containing sensor histidine kinase [Candidatus Dormibacteraeota bacterium]|nr:HAMP domain-containing sensor histidine kinase [Candidatus Dormibacteraeota bacterium]